jgi:hypothetical protein
VAAISAGAFAAAVAGIGGIALPVALSGVEKLGDYLQYERVVGRVRTARNFVREIRRKHLSRLEIVASPRTDDWALRVAHERGVEDLSGAAAVQTGGTLLARLNRRGASSAEASRAVKLLTDSGGATPFIIEAARVRMNRQRTGDVFHDHSFGPLGLTGGELLALEMALNEDAERQALEGELALLEQAWRDAEEIAAIADNLLLPRWIAEHIVKLKTRE